MTKSGGQLIVDAMQSFGTQRVFCVPGESYLPVLDALHDSDIQTVVCRQEGGAAIMAEATGKLTGAPGICLVTRGPGACNAAAGVHIASQDSTPMLLLIGQIATDSRHREMFQEVDYQQMFGGMAKWVAEIDTADRVLEMMSRAWHIATGGRPGPVVLVLPEDMLQQSIDIPTGSSSLKPPQQTQAWPGHEQVQRCIELLNTAQRPIAIIGGSRWSESAVTQFTKIAEQMLLPVACSFRRQRLFNHLHANYAGDVGLGINPQLASRIKKSDCVLLLGARFSEIPSQNFGLLDLPQPQADLIHVYPDASELGKLYVPALAIEAGADEFCNVMSAQLNDDPQEINATRADDVKQAHQQYLDWVALDHAVDSAKLMRSVIETMVAQLPADAVICNGAGNYSSWVHRFYPYQSFCSQLAPTSGSMGYGLPAAVAAKLQLPDKPVVALAGDGCLQMTIQELGTAAELNTAIIVLVVDNGMYGTIRMHQEMHFPGRVSATDLQNPDFAAIAKAYGIAAHTVQNADEFATAFEYAQRSSKATLIHLKVERAALTPTMEIENI